MLHILIKCLNQVFESGLAFQFSMLMLVSSSRSSSWIISLLNYLLSILKYSRELLDEQVVGEMYRRILLFSCLRP